MNFIKQFKKVKDKKIRKQLIENYNGVKMAFDPKCYNNELSQCIMYGLYWSKTPQGGDYWAKICIQAEDKKLELREGKKY